MKVFVTGATGFIGSVLVPDLIAAGHEVVGLARSDDTIAKLAAMGAGAHRGELDDADALAAGAAATDGVIHLAFDHGRMAGGIDEVVRSDRRAIDAIVGALAGSGKPFIGTSGVMVLTPGVEQTEEDAGDPRSAASFRVASEDAVLAAANRGVRASVVRLSPVVYGEGDGHGFLPMLIAVAREASGFGYVGEGGNRWPAVHRLDAAPLFRLALEKGSAGARYHGVGEAGTTVRAITEALGRRLGLPARSVPVEEAAAYFGPLAPFAATDIRTSSAKTREALGWEPRGLELLQEVKKGVYG